MPVGVRKDFDPMIKYGIPLDEWLKLSRGKRHQHIRKYKLDNNPELRKKQSRERSKKRYWRDPEKERKRINAEHFRRYWRDPEAARAKNRAKWARMLSKKKIKTDPDEILKMAMKAIPAGVPRHVRDDVIGSLMLAVLEGQVLVADIGKRVKEFLAAHNREYDHFKTKSLDVPIYADGGATTLGDRLTQDDLPW